MHIGDYLVKMCTFLTEKPRFEVDILKGGGGGGGGGARRKRQTGIKKPPTSIVDGKAPKPSDLGEVPSMITTEYQVQQFTGFPICSCTWVGLTWITMFHHLVQPNSHQPKLNRADKWIIKIQVNLTQVHEQMGIPVRMS